MSRATLRARLGVTAASAFTVIAVATAAAPSAHAVTIDTFARVGGNSHTIVHTHSHRHATSAKAARIRRHDLLVRKVITEARRQKGKPYVYGEDGPHGFDCSGLVRYVFLHSVHRSLPHNAAAQYYSLHHISRKNLEPGDLIFTDNGYISHVGIFAGHDHWWVAPHTGTRVQLQQIYSAHFVYARVLLYRHH